MRWRLPAIGGLLRAHARFDEGQLAAFVSYVDGPQWQAFFGASNDLVGCGHMSGLFARSIYPLALMKSDYRDPYQARELYARDKWRVVPGLRWRPCRSSRLLRAYQTRTYKTSLRMLLAAIGDVLTPSRTFRCGSFRRSSSSPR